MEPNRLYRLVLDAVRDPLVLARPGGTIVLANAAAEALFDATPRGRVRELNTGEAHLDGERLEEMMTAAAPVRDLQLDDTFPSELSVSIETVRPVGGDELKLLHFRRGTGTTEQPFWRDELIAMVSHELKNPLAAMRQSVDVLLTGAPGDLTDGQRRFLDASARSIDRLTHLVDGLLDVSRVREGALGLERERVDVREFIDGAVGRFATLFRATAVIEHRVDDTAGTAVIDPGKLEQVMVNLLGNALKHTPGDGKIQVDVDCAGIEVVDDELRLLPWKDLGAPRFLRIRVSDTGLGMGTDELERAFERYHERAAVSSGRGSHLGLNISRTLIEAQGGRMEIDSRIGIGTTVTVYLPADTGTACLLTRMGRARRAVERYQRARRRAAVVVVGKVAGDNWQDVASTWNTVPAVNPGPVERVGTPFQLWTVDGALAVGVVADTGEEVPVDRLFGERFVECADGSYVFNGFAVGVCSSGGARGFSQVCSVAVERMSGARNAMSQAIDERRDADLACVLNEWTRGHRL